MSGPVFGPVPSRRFGRSLGVDPVPGKTCNFDCIYCQLGRATRSSMERREYVNAGVVADAVRSAVEESPGGIDTITFIGRGEPTLASNLATMADLIRTHWDDRMALMTNGSMFTRPDVREAAMRFDVVAPTIAAGDEKTYRCLHRPAPGCTLRGALDGLRAFRREFRGEIWAEVMLVRGVNDTRPSLKAIRASLDEVCPDKVHVAVPIRPPSASGVRPPTRESIALALEIIGDAIDTSAPEGGLAGNGSILHLLGIAARHPLREDQALGVLGGDDASTEVLSRLVDEGRLERRVHEGTIFYRTVAGEGDEAR